MTMHDKIRALLAKTVANGCTPGEQEAAVAKARQLCEKHQLKAAEFTWPKPHRAEATAKAKPRKGKSREQRVLAMLQRASGVTVAQMMAEFGVLPHTARAYISVVSRTAGCRAALNRETGVYRIID